jgi:hypothetical protein
MDVAHTETANRLAQLGVPASNIERHLRGLQAAAQLRSAALERKLKAQQQPQPHQPRPPKELTDAQLQQLVAVLRQGPAPGQRWWWRVTRPRSDVADAWIGNAVERVTGKHCTEPFLETVLTLLVQRRLAHCECGLPPNRRLFLTVVDSPVWSPAPPPMLLPLPSPALPTAAAPARHRERLHVRAKTERVRLGPRPNRVRLDLQPA